MTTVLLSIFLAAAAPVVNVNAPVCNDNAATPANTLRVVRASRGYPPTGLTPQSIVHVYDLRRHKNVGWLITDDFGQQYLEPREGEQKRLIPPASQPIKVTFSDGSHTLFVPPHPWQPSYPYVFGMCTNT